MEAPNAKDNYYRKWKCPTKKFFSSSLASLSAGEKKISQSLGQLDIEYDSQKLFEEATEIYDAAEREENLEKKNGLYKEAAKLYNRLANKGHLKAQFNLGLMYDRGIGVEESPETAKLWFQKCAEQGDRRGYFALGLSHLNLQKFKEAKHWFKKAADQGDIISQGSQTALGYLYVKSKQFDKDVHWFQKAADNGYTKAQHMFAIMHLSGSGVEKSFEKAALWFQKAAEQKNADAQYELGMMYGKGQGLEYSSSEKIKWIKRAAKQGNINAEYELGRLYFLGHRMEKSYKRGVEWICKAAEKNHPIAKTDVRNCYYLGYGVLIDEKKANKFLEDKKNIFLSINIKKEDRIFGDVIDQFFQSKKKISSIFNPTFVPLMDDYLKKMLKEHKDKTLRNVVLYYLDNAKNEEKSAQVSLAILYYCGLGLVKDFNKSIEWLSEAAQRRNADAQEIFAYVINGGVRGKEWYLRFILRFPEDRLRMRSYAGDVADGEKNDEDDEEFPTKLTNQAKKGDKIASRRLGNLYADIKIERPLSTTNEEVFNWLECAYKNPRARYRLGRMYEYGWGTPKDKKAAFQCFKEGAEKGYSPAQKALAEMYLSGESVNQSDKQALRWYRRASKQEDAGASAAIKEMADKNIPAALYDLGRAHEEGWGIARDEEEAIALYSQAALQGYPQAQYAFSVKCLEGKAPAKEALDPLELLTTLSGEEARRNYLRFRGQCFNNKKEKKKLKELQEEGLPEKGYYKAQHKLAELYETRKVFPLKTVHDQKKSYQEAIRLYERAEEAIHRGRRVILTPLDKVRTELKRLEATNNEEAFDLDHPRFKEFLEERGSSKKFDSEFRTQLALIFNKTRELKNKELIEPLLDQLIKLPANSKTAWGALTGLESLIKSEEEINRETLFILSRRFSLMDPVWCFIPDPEEIELKNLKVAKWMLQDPRIDIFNSCFRGFEKDYYKDTFESSVKKIVSIFKKLHEPSCKNLLDQSFEYDLSSSVVNLQKLLTQKNDPTSRFAHRLVRISDIIQRKFEKAQLTRDFSSLTALRIMLAHWAERGEGDCRTGGEDELNKFYLEEIVNFRLKLVDDLVTEQDDDRIHAVKHLEKKVRVPLGLLGDAENYQDVLESTSVSSKYLKMSPQNIIEAVIQRYTPDRIAEHLANEFQYYQKDIHKGKAISNETHKKLYRRLRFQFLREAVAPGGNLDGSLFQDEDYLLDRCTKEDYERHLSLFLLDTPDLSKNYQDWDSLKGLSFDKAREKRERFYDDYQLFTPGGAKALLYGMRYLEVEY